MTTAPAAKPKLRPGLVFVPRSDGMVLHDPLRHRFFSLDPRSAEALQMLGHGETVASDCPHVRAAIAFAHQNGLLLPASPQEEAKLRHEATRRNTGLTGWLHKIISIRLPLLDPEPLLDRARPALDVLFCRRAIAVFTLILLAAIYLASRQASELGEALRRIQNPSGLLGLGAALLVAKIWHEIGHGHLARSLGCRAPSGGVLLILGAPMFYIDVSDAWRLDRKRDRMLVAAGGLIAELQLSAVALFAWCLIAPGHLRDVAFFIATASIVTSLAVNLSPFMRFDGYFLLSDALGIPNLHQKSVAALRHRVHTGLFGLKSAMPTSLNGLPVGRLALFGAGTVAYRLMLYVGLALLAYQMLFKLLGVAMFALEMLWFVLLPLWREAKLLFAERKAVVVSRRFWLTAGLATALAVLCLVPLSWSVRVQGVVEARATARLHAPQPAEIVRVHAVQGETVKAGELLIEMRSADLDHRLRLAAARLALAEARLARIAGDNGERSKAGVLSAEVAALRAECEGLRQQQQALHLRAPIDGYLAELDRTLVAGRFVNPRERLALVIRKDGMSARGYASPEAMRRLATGAKATFVPEDPSRNTLSFSVTSLAVGSSEAIDIAALASTGGGQTPVAPDRNARLIAANAVYLVTLQGVGHPPSMSLRGTLHVAAKPESLARRALARAASVLIRESGV